MSVKTVRINMNMSENLLNRIDDYAVRCGTSRSSVIAMCCDSWLNQLEAMKTMPLMADLLSNLKGLEKIE